MARPPNHRTNTNSQPTTSSSRDPSTREHPMGHTTAPATPQRHSSTRFEPCGPRAVHLPSYGCSSGVSDAASLSDGQHRLAPSTPGGVLPAAESKPAQGRSCQSRSLTGALRAAPWVQGPRSTRPEACVCERTVCMCKCVWPQRHCGTPMIRRGGGSGCCRSTIRCRGGPEGAEWILYSCVCPSLVCAPPLIKA